MPSTLWFSISTVTAAKSPATASSACLTHNISAPLCRAVIVKMETKPFAAGAMRECYAMKKLSTFT